MEKLNNNNRALKSEASGNNKKQIRNSLVDIDFSSALKTQQKLAAV